MQNKDDIRISYFWGQGKVASKQQQYRDLIAVGQSLSRAHERDCRLAEANQNTNAARLACFIAE